MGQAWSGALDASLGGGRCGGGASACRRMLVVIPQPHSCSEFSRRLDYPSDTQSQTRQSSHNTFETCDRDVCVSCRRVSVHGGRRPPCVWRHTQILKKKKKNTVCGACQSAISGIVCKDDGADPHPAANKYTPRIWTAGRGKRTRGNRNRTLVTHVRSVLRARTICARTPWGRAPSS